MGTKFYHGTDKEFEKPRLNPRGIFWLTGNPKVAFEYGNKYYSKKPVAYVWEVELKPNARLANLKDLSHPAIRAAFEAQNEASRSGMGVWSEKDWEDHADFGLLERWGWMVKLLKSKRLDGVFVRDTLDTTPLAHDSLALFRLGAIASLNKTTVDKAGKTSRPLGEIMEEIAEWDRMNRQARRVFARFIYAKSDKKRMVVMMGPPAAGKGFFLGEPPPKYGWKLPQMLVDDAGKPLLSEEDIPESPAQDESDNHLRAIQNEEAREHFAALQAAHKSGKDAFKKAMADHWYATKDGARVELDNVVSFDEFPDDFEKYFTKTNKDFYVSMRGWHDDANEVNKATGKPKERFKDEARHRFDESVNDKIERVKDFLIVDSAGEDIDAQDYKGQIEQAKANGYEVTVIFLHPEQADTELSNLARGKVMGKRMVDQADITNWYERNAEALQDIQAAAPDNFVHYRKGPPDPDPKKAAELRAKARDTMNNLAKLSGDEKEAAKKEVNKILYGKASYQLNRETSYGKGFSDLPKEPKAKSIADAVSTMNSDAQKRAKSTSGAGSTPSKTEKAEKEEGGKPKAPAKKEKSKTRMDFLRDVGDKKVPNPNPDSRGRYPQIKIRSLPWTYQKRFYDQWSQRAAALRVASRYGRKMAAKKWLAGWMDELSEELGALEFEGYTTKAKAGVGPEVLVTIEGGSEDATTARKAREKVTKVMEASIKKHTDGASGYKAQVRTYNHNADILLECTVIFP